MPLYPDASPPPRKDRGESLSSRRAIEPAAPSMFAFSLGATRLYVTYAVPIAIAACFAVASFLSLQPDSDNVATSFLLGSSFWFIGFTVQVVSHLAVWGVWGERCESVTVGLQGVEFPPIHHSPRRSILLSIVTVIPLSLAAATVTLVGVAWAGENFWLADENLTLPSLGTSTSDRVWQAGGMLLMFQMACQFFPLPRTPGRQILLASIAESFRHLDMPRIVLFSRRVILLIAVIVAMVALALLPSELDGPVQHWPIVFLIAVLLWVSTRNEDIEVAIWSLVNAGASRRGPVQKSLYRRAVQNVQSIAGRRRAKRAYLSERNEAADASRLDEILTRLHEHGEKSLSNEDRAVLRRVSVTLRKTKAERSNIHDSE
jgi:hypothetical protein